MSWLWLILIIPLTFAAVYYFSKRSDQYLRRRVIEEAMGNDIVSIVEVKTDQILKLSPRSGVKQGGSALDQLRRRLHGRMSSIPSVTINKQEKTLELLWDAWGRRKALNFSEIRGLKVSMDRVDREIGYGILKQTVLCSVYKISLVVSDMDSITIAQEADGDAAESLAAEIAQFLGLETVDKLP